MEHNTIKKKTFSFFTYSFCFVQEKKTVTLPGVRRFSGEQAMLPKMAHNGRVRPVNATDERTNTHRRQQIKKQEKQKTEKVIIKEN